MKAIVERIHAIGAHAWLRFLQIVNGLLIGGAGLLETVNLFYPGALANLVTKLPPIAGLVIVAATGAMIHYAARRAKKAAANG